MPGFGSIRVGSDAFGGISVSGTFISVIASDHLITITCGDIPNLTGMALNETNWSIIDNSGSHLLITSIETIDNTILLHTTEQVNGSSYILTVPSGIEFSGDPFAGPFDWIFNGVGSNPSIIITRVVDSRLIEVWYNSPVYLLDAIKPTNYTITNSGGLSVISVIQISNTIFQLSTSAQLVDAAYTVTASNIRNILGNFN